MSFLTASASGGMIEAVNHYDRGEIVMEEAKFIHPDFRPVQPISSFGDSQLSEDDLRLTEDDLPSSDGTPMETERHVLQMMLLIETLRAYWANRNDVL
jgi:hypothetical protein